MMPSLLQLLCEVFQMLVKSKEFVLENNDTYFLEKIADKLIVNDNYTGVIIFNESLDIIKTLKLFEGITIYSSYINYGNEEILLYCPDNEVVVYINLSSYYFNVFPITNGMENLIFSKIYKWNKNYVYVYTYNLDLVKIDTNSGIIRKVDGRCEKDIGSMFHGLFELLKDYEIIKIFQCEQIAIIKDKDNYIYALNYHNKTKRYIKKDNRFIDIDYKNEMYVMVNENLIEVSINNNEETLCPDANYMFLKSKLFRNYSGAFLVVMCSNKSNVNDSKLLVYKAKYEI